jgi:hypothetical protein
MRLIEEKEKPMTNDDKLDVIRVINLLKDWSAIDDLISDWKQVDDMDGPLGYALYVREEVNNLIAKLEGKAEDEAKVDGGEG